MMVLAEEIECASALFTALCIPWSYLNSGNRANVLYKRPFLEVFQALIWPVYTFKKEIGGTSGCH